MLVIALPIKAVVKAVQVLNTPMPKVITEFGILAAFKLVHSAKARSPIDIRVFGKVMEVSALQSENALLPISVVPFSIESELML